MGQMRNVVNLLRNKKRKVASQFEDLQSAYLRLRANQMNGSASAEELSGLPSESAGALAPDQGPSNGAPQGAIVDQGLHEFSRMLAVLMRCNKLKVLAEIPRPSLRQSSSIISSVEFDRDGLLFATAGVSKRIR